MRKILYVSLLTAFLLVSCAGVEGVATNHDGVTTGTWSVHENMSYTEIDISHSPLGLKTVDQLVSQWKVENPGVAIINIQVDNRDSYIRGVYIYHE